MADLVSPIVDIISRLWTCCARHTRYLCKLHQNIILLRNAMKELTDARNDVLRTVIEAEADLNEPKMRTDSVSGWLQSIQIIERQVEEILHKADEQLKRARSCLGVCCPPNNCWSNYKVGKSIAKRIPLVVELKGKGNFEQVTYILPTPSVQDMNLVSTVGMESMFDKVWRLINSTDDPVRIMGLHGHGGVGKTTLLEKINNEFNKISEHDHVVIFVVVSKPIDVQAIQTQIGERLRLSLQGDERRRANQIFNMLKNKKLVILLDDLWGRVDLHRIGIPSPLTQCNSSKIVVIFTTRSQRVCGLMEATHTFQVECLPWDKAWSLFQDKVGEKALNYLSEGGARELAKDVAKECGGLPLALITIGRAMSTKKSVEEWRDAIKTLRTYASKFEGMSDEVLARLKLSYDNLSDETEKCCFRYCALFPEDYSIQIAQLVELWIAEGFLDDGFDHNNLDEARDRGHTIIGSLKSACLLESSWEKHVKMHDVIRDLALWIVNDCKSSSSTTSKFLVASNVCERWRNAERIFLNGRRHTHGYDDNNVLELEEPPTSLNLQTLVVDYRGTSSLPQKVFQFSYRGRISLPQSFFQFTPFLRVLDMSETELTELPTSICQLYELQYLNLSFTGIKELPIELRRLVKLKFLDLNYAQWLEKIPPGVIANLSELQVIKLVGSGFEDWGLKEEDGGLSLGELDRLKQLQEVTLNISTSLALEELLCNQKLRRICTALILSCENLESISLLPPSSTTTSKGGLGNLINLKYLEIMGCVKLEELILFLNDEGGETNTTTTTTTTSAAAAAAAGLPISNNNKLEKLKFYSLPRLNNIVWEEKYHHYMAAAQQHHLHYASPFQNLYSIEIFLCDALKDLTWVVYVENLENLVVSVCNRLETIIELCDDDGLEEEGASGGFRRLKTLRMWSLPNLKSICSHALGFPSIHTIEVRDCPELKKLSLDSRSNINNTLQNIVGKKEWWNELQWENETIKSKFLPYLTKSHLDVKD